MTRRKREETKNSGFLSYMKRRMMRQQVRKKQLEIKGGREKASVHSSTTMLLTSLLRKSQILRLGDDSFFSVSASNRSICNIYTHTNGRAKERTNIIHMGWLIRKDRRKIARQSRVNTKIIQASSGLFFQA